MNRILQSITPRAVYKTFLGIGLILGLSGIGHSACDPTLQPTYTTRSGIVIPQINSCSWGAATNANWGIIDSSMCVQGGTNNFTGSNSFFGITLKNGSATIFNSSGNSKTGSIQNNGTFVSGPNQNALEILSADGLGINGQPLGTHVGGNPDVVIYPGTNETYGTFAVIGSSANNSTAYSGFTSTSPIGASTLWSLPPRDGLANTPLVTDGAAHLSFKTYTPNSCMQTDANGVPSVTGSNCGSGGSGGSSTLQITQGGVQITSPTPSINFNNSQFTIGAVGSTATVALNGSSVTLQGNNLSATYLTNSSATLTYVQASSVAATYVAVGSNQYIQNTSFLQSGSTFYVSSGTVSGQLTVSSNTVLSGAVFYQNMPSVIQGTQFFTNGSVGIGANNTHAANTLEVGNEIYADDAITSPFGYFGGFFEQGTANKPALAMTDAPLSTFGFVENNGVGSWDLGYGGDLSSLGTPILLWNKSPWVDVKSSMTVEGARGLNVTYGVVGGSLTLNNVASGTQCLQADSSGHVTGTGGACGSGGGSSGLVSLSTGILTPAIFTSSVTNTSAGGEAVTYGVSAGSLTLTGTGNMSITENGLTGQVVLSTGTPTLGQVAMFGSSATIVSSPLRSTLLAVDANGVLVSSTVTGGSGGSGTGSGTITVTPQYQVPFMSLVSSNVITSSGNFTNTGSTITMSGVGSIVQTNVSSETAVGVLFDYSASTMIIKVSTLAVINNISDSTGHKFIWPFDSSGNFFAGFAAGNQNGSGGTANTAFGYAALNDNTGNNNTAVGGSNLEGASGSQNTAIGASDILFGSSGDNNTIIGSGNAENNATTAHDNTDVGFNNVTTLTSGLDNSSLGSTALQYISTGSSNTAVGYGAGTGIFFSTPTTTGAGNTFIGYGATIGATTQLINATAIGYNAVVLSSNTMQLGGVGSNAETVNIGTMTVSSETVTNITVSTFTFNGATFASLASNAPNGSFKYCADCTVTTPVTCTSNALASCVCAGSGTGAFARRLNGTWYCGD